MSLAEVITASAAHAPLLAALHKAAFADEPWDGPSFTALLAQPGMHGLIDPRGGFLLLRVVADEAEIITIGAGPKRQGVGRALLQAGLDYARNRGVAAVFLEVAAGNLAGRSFYDSFGFAQAGMRRKYYANGEDALVLKLSLSG